MPYVERDEQNRVVAIYAAPQPGVATEYMDDGHPDLSPRLGQSDLAAAISAMIEATARSRDYDSAASLASYATSTIPAWKAEAETFLQWRDLVWVHALTELEKVVNGQRNSPASAEAFVAELPVIVWPEAS